MFQNLFIYTNYTGFGFGGMVLGFAYPYLVVTGLHQGLLPIEAQLITQTSQTYGHAFTWITPIATVSNISQGMVGLCLFGLLLHKKKHNQKILSTTLSGNVSANLGITEPILFGVNVPLRWPLLVSAIAGGIGGYWIGATHTVANSLGSASWLGLAFQFDYTVSPSYAKYIADNNINAMLTNLAPVVNMVIAAVITTFAAVGFCLLFGKLKYTQKATNAFLENNIA